MSTTRTAEMMICVELRIVVIGEKA